MNNCYWICATLDTKVLSISPFSKTNSSFFLLSVKQWGHCPWVSKRVEKRCKQKSNLKKIILKNKRTELGDNIKNKILRNYLMGCNKAKLGDIYE